MSDDAPDGPDPASIQAYSVDELVQGGVFRFTPPLIERSPRPKALYLWWRAFQLVFEDIPDPRQFKPLSGVPGSSELAAFRRYIQAAEDLAESELLCGSDSMSVHWDNATGVETVETAFTSNEVTRG